MPDVILTDEPDNETLFRGTDTVTALGGDDTIDGGEGEDVSIYRGAFDEYEIQFLDNGQVRVTDLVADRDGSDLLTSIEAARFTDKEVNLQPAQDIVIVIDQSGSMNDDISAIERSAEQLIDAIFQEDNGLLNSRIAFVTFEREPMTVFPFTDMADPQERKDSALAELDGIRTFGGTENISAALLHALDGSVGDWRPDATIRRIFLFGDERGDDRGRLDEVYELAADVSDGSGAAVPVQISTITTGGANTDTSRVFQNIADRTGGEALSSSSAGDLVDVILSALAPATDGSDVISGTIRDNVIRGLGGDDTLSGDAGADTIFGGPGDDRISGGTGPDSIKGQSGGEFITGDAGADMIEGGRGDDSIEGNSGTDRVNGGPGNDTVEGGLDNDTVIGGLGDDRVVGQMGDDFLQGRAGDDELFGVDGNDTLKGGAGNDTLDGGNDDDRMVGQDGDDSLEGTAGNDLLYGQLGADTLRGGNGEDTISGGVGTDLLRGGQGADVLDGGIGQDTLNGGFGDDTLTGGQGADVFVLNDVGGADTVLDFEVGLDMLRVRGEGLVITDVGGDAVLTLDSGASLTLVGVDADFI